MVPSPTAEDIRSAYRLLLGREPENETVVENWHRLGSFDQLREAFLASSEFMGMRPGAPGATLVPLEAPPIDVEWQTDAANGAALLAHVRAVWTRLGTERPHWSVLSAERFQPENISESTREFYASGAQDTAMLVACLKRHGLAPAQFPRMFEFGCGVGRVTPFMARAFRQVTACDVSASHMDMARGVVKGAGLDNITLNLVQGAEFGMTGPFDLWFSRLVLQHNPPPVMAMILRRAFSMLAPGGVAAFQVPTYAIGYRFAIAPYLQGMSNAGGIEMHVLPQSMVLKIAAEYGCLPLEIWQDGAAGNAAAWVSNTFLFRKQAAIATANFSLGTSFRTGG